jgi:hypothetical protein
MKRKVLKKGEGMNRKEKRKIIIIIRKAFIIQGT